MLLKISSSRIGIQYLTVEGTFEKEDLGFESPRKLDS